MKLRSSNEYIKPKVLLVDQDEASFPLLQSALHSLRCEIVHFNSSDKALQYLELNEVAVLLLSIKMTPLDGFGIAKKIRKINLSKMTPLIFIMDNEQTENNLDRIVEAGAFDSIQKPINSNMLNAKVRYFVDMYRKTKELEEKTALLQENLEDEKTSLLENSLDAVIGINEENLVTFWNKNAERLFGWTKAEVLGTDMSIIVPDRLKAAHLAGMKRFIHTGVAKIQNQRIEIPGLRKNGDEFLMELTVSSVKTSSGYRFFSFMRDITESKNIERSLKQREVELRNLANSIPQLAWMADADGSIFWYNERWYEYTGTHYEQMKGWGWQQVHDPEILPLVESSYRNSIEIGEADAMEFPLKSKYGEYRWFLTRWVPLKDANGKVLRWFGTNTDIHDQRLFRLDQVFRANLTMSLNATDDLTKLVSIATKSLAEYLSVIRCFVTEIKGTHATIHADYFDGLPSLRGKYDTRSFGNEMFQSWKTGHIVNISNIKTDVRSSSDVHIELNQGISSILTIPLMRAGELVGAMSVADNKVRNWSEREIELVRIVAETVWAAFERALLLEALKVSTRRSDFLSKASGVLNSSLEVKKILSELCDLAIPDLADWCSIRMLDSQGNLKQVAVSHKDPEKVKWAWELQKRFPPDLNAQTGPFKVIRTAQAERFNNITDEMLIATSNGTDVISLLRTIGFKSYICAPILSRGRVVGTLTFVTTEESNRRYSKDDESLAVELGIRAGIAVDNARLYLEAQAVNRLKDEFLANLSHELRTPMSVIQGHAEILKSEVKTMSFSELSDSIDAIERNAKAQTTIIADLLDVSSIITGKVSYKPTLMNPAEIVHKIIESLRPTAAAKGITFTSDLENAPKTVSADLTRFHQILWNLVSNAIKFTDNGGQVSIKLDHSQKNWTMKVTDNGRGIDHEFLPYVFDRFRQEDASSTRRFGGLGLGLSVVRHLVELHGGSVKAESKGRGQGSTFIITMPLNAKSVTPEMMNKKLVSEESIQKPTANLELKNINVLLVEDSPDNRYLVTRILSRAGAKVVEAESAESAREQLKSFKPDVIVSDIGMPEENGLEFMRKLRSSCSIPAIALTAYVRDEEKGAAIAAGFQSHIPKPVSATALVNEIFKLISH